MDENQMNNYLENGKKIFKPKVESSGAVRAFQVIPVR